MLCYAHSLKKPAHLIQVWIVAGDIVLLSLRDFQDDRADVIHKYTADEARNLKTYGELKSDFTIHEAAQGEGGELRPHSIETSADPGQLRGARTRREVWSSKRRISTRSVR